MEQMNLQFISQAKPSQAKPSQGITLLKNWISDKDNRSVLET